MVSVGYSLPAPPTPPPPPRPSSPFVWKPPCLLSIDVGLLTSVASDITLGNLWSSGLQKPLNPAQCVALCLKKKHRRAADSHPFMWSFGETRHAAARNSYDRLSLCHRQRGVMHPGIT